MDKNKERLELLQEVSNTGIWEYYFDKDVAWASKKVFELYGEKNIDGGFDPDLVFKYATEDSKKRVNENFSRLKKEEIPYSIVIEIDNPLTKQRHYLLSSARIVYNDKTKKKRYLVL